MHPAIAAPSTPESQSVPRWVKFFAEMRFFTFSLLLHVVLLVLCGTLVIYRTQEEPPQFVASGSGGLVTDTSLLDPPPESKPEEHPQAAKAPSAAAAPSSSVIVDIVSTASSKNSFAVSTTNIKTSLNGIGDGDLGKLGKGLGIDGQGLGMGGAAMRFFGTKATGQNIVIVVDVSGSMVHGKGKSGKTYGELEKEVIRVVREMDLKSSFGLIVFSSDAKPYRSSLVRSTSEEKERAITWLKRNNPIALDDPKTDPEVKAFHHGTRVDRGMEEAFALGPDLIFFVSDGEPTGGKPEEVIAQVEAAQKNLPKPAAIHAIAYLADGGQKFMRELAEKNGGMFREVNPKDLEQ